MYYKVCDKYFVLSVCTRRSCAGDGGGGSRAAVASLRPGPTLHNKITPHWKTILAVSAQYYHILRILVKATFFSVIILH